MSEDRNLADFVVAPEVARTLEQTQIGKFHTKGGHGFAAEDANALADRLRGKRVETVGTNNAVNGADRVVNGVSIQTKYHQSPSLTIGDAFDAKTGVFRYQGQLLEVPKDQYDECVKLMRERIAKGQVLGVTDPMAAEQIVKQGEVTYKQARNIARAGNIDSLLFDTKSQAVTTTYAFAISFSIQFARCKWNGTPTAQSVRSAIASGVATGGTTLITGIVSAQLLRTKVAAIGAVTVRDGMRVVASTSAGRKVVECVAQASLGKAVYGAAAVNHVAKLLRSNLITSGVVVVVTTAPDFYRAAIARSISWQQFTKNGVVTAAGVAAGTGGWLAGAATGAAVGSTVPVVGTVAGGIVGGLIVAVAAGCLGTWGAKVGMDCLADDDAKRMLQLLQEAVSELAEDYMMSEAEIEQLVAAVKAQANAGWLRSMYQAGAFSSCSDDESRAFAYKTFDEGCLHIIEKRERVALPPPADVQSLIDQLAVDVLKQEDVGWPNLLPTECEAQESSQATSVKNPALKPHRM